MLLPLISRANRLLGAYAQALEGLPDPYVLLRQLNLAEAVSSTRIEGTRATAEEVLRFAADRRGREDPGKDIREVNNNMRALEIGRNGIL